MTKTLIITGTIIFLITSIGYIQNLRWKNRLKRIKNSRPPLSRREFIDSMTAKGFDEKHVEVVYDKLREFICLDDFPIYPEDDIHGLFKIDDLDDIELIDQICQELDLRKAVQEDCDPLNKVFDKTNAEYILTLMKNKTRSLS